MRRYKDAAPTALPPNTTKWSNRRGKRPVGCNHR